ncbi:MAG: hypothetical protein FJ109_11375 [Deltaproteobacteria bacterium]|nr:hypothetical protein [Deltaproteobacteria bacterium]
MKMTLTIVALLALTATVACSGGGDKKPQDVKGNDVTGDAAADVPLDVPADAPLGDAAPDGPAAELPPVPDAAADVAPPGETQDGRVEDDILVKPDVEETGPVSVAGTLALSNAPVPPTDDGMYILALLPPDYPFGGDPGKDILAALPLFPGAGYSGDSYAIPAQGNTFLQWDADAQGSPIVPVPFETLPGKFTFLAAYKAHADDAGDPTHVTFMQVEVVEVPAVLDLGALVLTAMEGPPSCKYEGKYELESIACNDLDITADFKASVTKTQITVSSLEGGGCRIEASNSGPSCAEQEIIDLVEADPGLWNAAYQGVSSCNPDACKFNDDDAPCVLGDRKGEGTIAIQEQEEGKIKLTENSPVTLCAKYDKLPTITVFFPIN